VPLILSIAALFFGTLALARPQSAPETMEQYSEGIDIMLVLDTSGSMEETDFPPNRLEVAKKTAAQFLEGRVDDRIGVVVFAEDAFSYAPLTLDYDLLRKQIESLNSNIMPNRGTAVGSAIAVAINRMQESNSPSKVIILLTDGASNRGQIDPITAAKLAADAKIKIHSIGIGKKEYQKETMFGSQTVQSDLDEGTLMEVSRIANGKFFRSEDPESLGKIFDLISQMEKTEIVTEMYREVTDLYPTILIVTLILMAISFGLMATFIYNPLEG
jgi:Ca-activated chloride channel family protein